MKALSLKFNREGINFGEEDGAKSDAEHIYDTIKLIILSQCHEEKGFNEEERRKFYKLCDAFESAMNHNSSDVILEDDQAKFIKSCRSKAKLIPNRFLQRVEEAIDNIRDIDLNSAKKSKLESVS